MSSKRGRASSPSEEDASSSSDGATQSGSGSERDASTNRNRNSANVATRTKKPKSKRPRQDVATETDSNGSDSDSDNEEAKEVLPKWSRAPRKDGLKWNTLEHHGPIFAPPYEPLPKNVHFKYNGTKLSLSLATEEAAGYYARYHGHDYTKNDRFKNNFFEDWQDLMTSDEKKKIRSLDKCDFSAIHAHFQKKAEERKAMSKEEKAKIKQKKEENQAKHGTCIVDGKEVKIGNSSVEPPGLFIGRGENPMMGKIKKRVQPEDVTINCGKQSKHPVPPTGHKWKAVQHDQKVTWLARWRENIYGEIKYIQLHQTSDLKRKNDYQKYEKARELSKKISAIRGDYRKDWNSKDLKILERSVAIYFIDKLALRAGNEKGKDTADTVGCCSLRIEHIILHKELDGKSNVVAFDFPGKDSIQYKNSVQVEEPVFKILEGLMKNKSSGSALFRHINPNILNQHLSELMKGLTAKVFRTYNASHTLQQQLNELTQNNTSDEEKLLAYNRANRSVAVLCNHQRTAPKNFESAMEKLRNTISEKSKKINKMECELRKLGKSHSKHKVKKECLDKSRAALNKLELKLKDKEEGKQIALGTSKLNYLDPRITVAWCKKWKILLEKVYNKTQREKFHWAIELADENFKFD